MSSKKSTYWGGRARGRRRTEGTLVAPGPRTKGLEWRVEPKPTPASSHQPDRQMPPSPSTPPPPPPGPTPKPSLPPTLNPLPKLLSKTYAQHSFLSTLSKIFSPHRYYSDQRESRVSVKGKKISPFISRKRVKFDTKFHERFNHLRWVKNPKQSTSGMEIPDCSFKI